MKRILIRSGMLPNDYISYFNMIEKNILGSNNGNLVYAYSIYKNLREDDNTEFIPTYYKYNFTEEEINRINDTCDYFFIPLADAIRENFMMELRGLTNLVSQLDIPCFVIGMGIRAPYNPPHDLHFSFDDNVKNFIDAVLRKSKMIGVRGGITAEYLTGLGYIEERDFTVIGCPSMYTFGDKIKIRDEKISSNSTICFSSSPETSEEVCSFIMRNAEKFEHSYYIPQNVSELKVMYSGMSIHPNLQQEHLPQRITDEVFLNGNAYFFANVPSWIKFLKKANFSFGARLHGNIISILAGTPSLLIVDDARKQELAEYHNFPHINVDDISEDKDIFKIIKNTDFHSVEKVHLKNFNHYLDFLNINGIPNIYNKPIKICNFEADSKEASQREPLKPITVVDSNEIAKRLCNQNEYSYQKDILNQQKIKKKDDTIRQQKAQIENYSSSYNKLEKDYINLKKEYTKLKKL